MEKKIFAAILTFAFLFVFSAPVAAANCRLVTGKTYYTDGVSYFKDSACHNEMTTAELNAGGTTSTSGTAAATGNCRYNYTLHQYTDGVAYFTDSKCTKEALNGQTAPEPAAQSITATVAQTTTATVTATQYAQLSQRLAALEARVSVLQSMIAQILVLLAKM